MTKMILSGLFCLSLLSVACSRSDNGTANANNIINNVPQAVFAGAYKSTACFKNKLASTPSQAIYTIATLTFNADKSGTMDFEVFSDAACAHSLGTGTTILSYEDPRIVGDSIVAKINQIDPNDSNNNGTFWLPMQLTLNGAYIDIDGSRAESGPYVTTEPSDAQISGFLADPTHQGIFFSKQ